MPSMPAIPEISGGALAAVAASVLAALAAASLVFALYRIFNRGGASERLDAYLNIPTGADFVAAETGDPRLAERINERINQLSFADRIRRDLALANLPLTVPEYLLLRTAIPALLALAALFIWRTPLLVPPAVLVGYVLPIFWLNARRSGRNRDFGDQLSETLAVIASSMRGGFSLLQSIANASREAQEPTKTELRRVSQEVQLGLSLSQALDNLARRVESEDLELVVSAIKIQSRVGGNLAQILETISSTIRERASLRREVRVITSMQRMSSYVIGLMPVALGLVIFAINPSYVMKLFEPGWTLCIPIGAFVFAVIGFVIIQKIVDIKV